MSQHDQVPCFCTRTLPPDAALLNRLQHLMPPVDYSFMSHIKLEHSNLGEIVDEIEEEEEELSDEEIMEEDEQEVEEAVNELILEEIIEEEEENVEVENMEATMESGWFVQTRMEYDIHLLNEGYQQTSGRRTRTARMQVNTNYIRYNIQVTQSVLDDTYSDEIEDEEEEVVEEQDNDINEFVDQDMSEYFERSTCYVTCVMDIDANEDGDDEEQEACAICLLEYKDEDNIGTLQCGHEFHAECINKWLQRKKSCPFCRASVLPTNT
ncbi:E3 ubiquitin ligase BIG BROTHER-related-like [Solanum verrucosum]|uniref:E3 ubiquitin ligase BIG BROTHER-related-like n=1 Tax=Solanum verrucosum TaxID=315347 RepID=UPI0020D09486|nr:E3 ubiquitin ligase BIG BROTHER-related-like [Solanum verrucosum]